jgi:hypothetical membrane protein
MSQKPNPPPGTHEAVSSAGASVTDSAPLRRANGPVRIRFFTDRYDWMGPVIVVLSSWYFAAQVLTAWVFRPHYSFVSNAISDLGYTACHPSNSGICSPLYVVMDVSIAILGLAMIVGSVLIFSEFSFSKHRREQAAAITGFACLALGGLGAILVGAVPENVNTAHLHTVGTAMAIGLGQLAILILGLVLREIDDWLREFMLVTSLLVLLAGISIAGNHHFGIGGGALERLAQYPESVWLILFGFYISRNHYRKEMIGRHFTFKGERPARESTFRRAFGESVESVRLKAPQSPPKPGSSGIATKEGGQRVSSSGRPARMAPPLQPPPAPHRDRAVSSDVQID